MATPAQALNYCVPADHYLDLIQIIRRFFSKGINLFNFDRAGLRPLGEFCYLILLSGRENFTSGAGKRGLMVKYKIEI